MPAPSTEKRGRQHNGNPSRGECAASLASHYFTVSICNWKEASLKCAKSINYPNTLALTSCKIGITSRCHVCSFLSHHVSVGVLYHSTWEGRKCSRGRCTENYSCEQLNLGIDTNILYHGLII